MRAPARCALLLPLLMIATADGAGAQIPDTFTNLQVLPEDITRDSLIAVMRSFSFATGLRCEGCHVQTDSATFSFDFALDDRENKNIARHMLRMVNRLNDDLLAGLPERDGPRVLVECKTCHRGLNRPMLLRTELRHVIDEHGADSAVAHYRELRAEHMDLGAYDFREWEMNELARQLAADDMLDAAVAMLHLNEEHHPTSAAIPLELGRLYERLGRPESAVESYRRALERNPRNRFARDRVDALAGS